MVVLGAVLVVSMVGLGAVLVPRWSARLPSPTCHFSFSKMHVFMAPGNAQDGSISPKEGLKMAPSRPPDRPPESPQTAHDSTRRPNTAQDGPKKTSKTFKFQDGRGRPQKPKMSNFPREDRSFSCSRKHPRWVKMAPTRPQDGHLKAPRQAPGTPKTEPRRPPRPPRRPTQTSKIQR